MFNNANEFKKDISDWNISNVTNMNFMFYNSNKNSTSNIRWNITTNISMTHMFNNNDKIIAWHDYMRNTIIKNFYNKIIDNITLDNDYMFAFFGDTEEQYDHDNLGFDISYNLLNSITKSVNNNNIILTDFTGAIIENNGIININLHKVSDVNKYLQSIIYYSYIIDEYITRDNIGSSDNVTNYGNHYLALIKKQHIIKNSINASNIQQTGFINYYHMKITDYLAQADNVLLNNWLLHNINNEMTDYKMGSFNIWDLLHFGNKIMPWSVFDGGWSHRNSTNANNHVSGILKTSIHDYINTHFITYPNTLINLFNTPYFIIFTNIENDNSYEQHFGIQIFNDDTDNKLYAYGNNKQTVINLKIPKYRWMFNNRTGCRFRIKC